MARKQLDRNEEQALSRLIDRDFNKIRLQNLEKLFPNFYDYTTMSREEYDDGIIWNWIFEAKDDHLAKEIIANEDDIAKKAGVAVINLSNEISDEYDTGVFIGFTGAGYDFLGAHWYPLYKILYPDLDTWYMNFA